MTSPQTDASRRFYSVDVGCCCHVAYCLSNASITPAAEYSMQPQLYQRALEWTARWSFGSVQPHASQAEEESVLRIQKRQGLSNLEAYHVPPQLSVPSSASSRQQEADQTSCLGSDGCQKSACWLRLPASRMHLDARNVQSCGEWQVEVGSETCRNLNCINYIHLASHVGLSLCAQIARD